MKFHKAWLPLFAAALAVPGAVHAQEDDDCPCRRPGMIGVVFDEEGDDGVRIVEVRRGSPADEGGLEEGDVVVRINGRDAREMYDDLPQELEAGDTVRIHLRRGGGERDVTVVAAPRPGAGRRFGIVRPGPGDGPVIFMGSDTLPLQAITMRIDSLHTRLMNLDSGRVRIQMDSLVRMFTDSAGVFIQRMPNMEIRLDGPELERLESELGRLDDEAFRLDTEAFRIEGAIAGLEDEAFMMERPFFMELGRRAAAGAELAEMNEGLRRYFDNVQGGALVIEVSPNTPAARAGLEAGDVIVRAGGREVNDPDDVQRALRGAEDGRVALQVVRQGRRRDLTLEWDGRDRIIRREVTPRARERVRVEPRRAQPRGTAPRN